MKYLTAAAADTATFNALLESQTDVTGAAYVDVAVGGSPSHRVLWVNVNGACLLRICQIENLTLPINEVRVPVPVPNTNTDAVLRLVKDLETQLNNIRRGFSDSTPTRMIPYGNDVAMKVDEWWQNYFARDRAATRSATVDAMKTLDDIKDLLK